MKPTIEHRHRLDRRLYQGRIVCSFTCCVQNRAPLFTTEFVFSLFEQKLLESLEKNNCGAHVYFFMPDHLHLLAEGFEDEVNLWRMVVDFKQQTGYWLSMNERAERWQKDFFDHILRKDEDVHKQVAYILNNPVRAGLVEDWRKYPYRGSTIYDLNTLEL